MRTLLVVAVLLAAGCAHPVPGVWPPRAGEPTHRLVVSTDSWHSVVGLCGDDGSLEEWGYADKAYYLEGDDGVCGTLRALCLPDDAVVIVTRGKRPWAERTPQPPARTWEFDLTDAGRDRLVAFLHGDVADPTPVSQRGGAEWFDATSSYHAFHHCHHWTASALREAGLPVVPVYAAFKWMLERQLDRAAEIAGAAPPPRRIQAVP